MCSARNRLRSPIPVFGVIVELMAVIIGVEAMADRASRGAFISSCTDVSRQVLEIFALRIARL